MESYSLPYFADLNPANVGEYYDVDIEFHGQTVQIDLNFENKSIDPKRLDIAKWFIENISTFDTKNKQYIEQDYANEGNDTVRTYVEHYMDYFDEGELSNFIDFENKTISSEVQLIKSLRLVRMGLYPDSEDNFATFDYSIDPDTTDQLVVIFTRSNGEMNYMTMES
jgi:hypothetical protein